MGRYFLYHRVSKKIQSIEGQGVERQVEATQQWIDIHNELRVKEGKEPYTFGRRYEDKGKSGYTQENIRKGQLGKLFADIEKRIIVPGDIIVFELIDRFSRAEPNVVRSHFENIMKAEIKVAVTKWNTVFETNMSGPGGLSARIMLEVGLHLANEESRVKSERILATNKILADQGIKTTAKTPIWLNRTKDRKGFEVVEENANVIRRIFELRKNGFGAKRIINELGPLKLARYTYNEEGELVASSYNRPLSESSVNLYLRDQTVIGYRDGVQYCEPIVEEKLFYACQQKIRKSKGGKVTKIKNVLSGLGYCEKCGKKMVFAGENISARGKIRSYIKCNNKAKTGGCDAKSIRYEPLERCVYNLLHTLNDREEITVDIGQLEMELAAAQEQAANAQGYMIRYPNDSSWVGMYEEQKAKVYELNNLIADAKAERSGRLTEMNLDLTKHENKALFNQILKDYDVKAVLGYESTSDKPKVKLVIGAWGDFVVSATVDKNVSSRRVRAAMKLGAEGIDFDQRDRGHIQFKKPEEFASDDAKRAAFIDSLAKNFSKTMSDQEKQFILDKVQQQNTNQGSED
ncbi:recombinase family protein [Vibrio splendidus]